ncbi:hypothetical protein VPH209E381_0099 [Vibrio phage 209E38-1]
MKVYGHTVCQDLIETAFMDCTACSSFTTRQVKIRLFSLGVHKDACYRAADRLVQKWRKEGKIFYDKGNQCWRDIKHYDAIYG